MGLRGVSLGHPNYVKCAQCNNMAKMDSDLCGVHHRLRAEGLAQAEAKSGLRYRIEVANSVEDLRDVLLELAEAEGLL